MMKQWVFVLATLVLAVNAQIHPDIIEDAHLDSVSLVLLYCGVRR